MKVEINKVALGQRIKNIRQKKGLTLKEFGELFGAEKGIVSRWENGKTIPNADRLKKLSIIGDVDLNYLLYGDILHFIYDYLKIYLPSEKKFLANHIPAYEFQKLKKEIDSKNLSYTDLEQINPMLDKMIEKTELYFQDTVIKYKNYILKHPEFQKETFKKIYSEFDIFRNNYSELSDFINDISTDNNQHLSDISNCIDGFYNTMETIMNKEMYFSMVETIIISEREFVENYNIEKCEWRFDQISLMNNQQSIEDYNSVVTLYNELFSESYSIAWYGEKKAPLIEGKEYLFYWGGDILEIGTYVKHGDDEIMILKGGINSIPLEKIDFYSLLLAAHF